MFENCPRCGYILSTTSDGENKYYACANCGYQETVPLKKDEKDEKK
jgi:DNA-directed RNA polymerase subunit M/transcription elongation factor TFIIS